MRAVVVTFDCLPVAMLGCYGNAEIRTPHWDALAEESVLFDACYAADVTPGRADRSAVAEVAGPIDRVSFQNPAAAALLPASAIQQQPELASSLRTRFADCVEQLDVEFGRWLEQASTEFSEDTLLIVTALSGKLLIPHPELARGCPPLVDPIVRVPLLVRWPSSDAAGTRRRGIVSTRDLDATLAEWLQADAGSSDGRSVSLWPLLRGRSESVREAAFFRCEGVGAGVRTAGFSCLCPEALLQAGLPDRDDHSDPGGTLRPWLFVKPDDRWDMLDVSRSHPQEAERLAQLVLEWARSE